MRSFGVIFFGVLAVGSTVCAVMWYKYFGGLLLLFALPLWIFFLMFLIRALKP